MPGVILFAMQILRENVCNDIMTKDVRTPEGWRISIKLGEAIQVWHSSYSNFLYIQPPCDIRKPYICFNTPYVGSYRHILGCYFLLFSCCLPSAHI